VLVGGGGGLDLEKKKTIGKEISKIELLPTPSINHTKHWM
jgi:hypothetical protein